MKAQTVAFTAIVVFEIARLHMIRSKYSLGILSNKWLVGAVVVSILLHLTTIYTPLSKFFHTAPLALIDWAVICLFGLILMGINVVIQKIKNR